MASKVIVTSKSKLLTISLENDRCLMTCSDDCSMLFVEPPPNTFVSTIELSLKDCDGKQISAVTFSAGCQSGVQRLRTDGLFSIVFDAKESIILIPNEVFDLLSSDFLVERRKFEMAVNINLLDAIPDSFESRSSTVLIHSGALKVADSTVPISSELMATTSLFFNALFYGGFSEHQKGIFEIKEIDKDEFIWFINSIHRRNWTFTSMDQALNALAYADRFEMLYLHKNVLPYFKEHSLPEEDIKETMLLCEKFKDNEQIMAWVLSQCKNVDSMIDLISDCSPSIQMSSIQSALKSLKVSVERANIDANIAVVKKCLENKELPVLLRFKDSQSGPVTSNKLFTLPGNTITWATQIWTQISDDYNTAKCVGNVYKRGQGGAPRYAAGEILDIEVYNS